MSPTAHPGDELTHGAAPAAAKVLDHTNRLTIGVSSGIGAGPTKLAAFDAALRQAGIANFNLIYLSSVMPPASDIVVHEPGTEHVEGAWGDRLYVVMAEQRVDTPHEEAWAGIGWIQERDTPGRGLFVEHHGHSQAQVQADINSSLDSLAAGRPHISFGDKRLVMQGTVCVREPVCALVAASFETTHWVGPPSSEVIDLG